MKLVVLLLLCIAVAAKSHSRGSSGSRSSSSSHSSTSTHSSSSQASSSGHSSVHTPHSSTSKNKISDCCPPRDWGGWFSFGSVFGSKRKHQTKSSSSLFSGWFGAKSTTTTASDKAKTNNSSHLQRIRNKISDATNKVPELTKKAIAILKPKLPVIASAAKKYGPKIGKFVMNKLRGTTTSRPETSSTISSANITTVLPENTTEKTDDEIFIPYNDDFVAECPETLDAFLQLGNISFIFENHHMFLVEDGSLNQTLPISDLFPGVYKVDAAVFDGKQELVLLFHDRKANGFHWDDDKDQFLVADGFPKELPPSIDFAPKAAFTWHDGQPVLVAGDGDYAIYDSQQNKAIEPGKNSTGFLDILPENAKGISDWDGSKAVVFTSTKVYQYDFERKKVVGKEESLGDFLDCFFVDIPSADEKQK